MTDFYKESLRDRLHAVSAEIAKMERNLQRGTPRERIEAAGDLAVFKDRRDELAGKLAKLNGQPEHGSWRAEIEQEIEAFLAEVRRFILHDRRFE